jgi:pyrrolidone-carboxylate peptidase
MGIIKKAKNISIIVKGSYSLIANTITKQAGKITITATKGDLILSSNKKVIIQAQDQIKFGDYIKPAEILNSKIVEMQFLDENGKILRNENLTKLNEICATDFLYGKKLKVMFFTKDVKDGTKIEFKLNGNSKDDCQDFFQIDKLKWNLEINNNTCETDFFTLHPLWYSENFECYNYEKHRTEVKGEDLNAFSVTGTLDYKFFNLPEKREDDLKPIAYLRNYEELIGLFSKENSDKKALIDNYENKFINYNPEVFKISQEFSGYLNYSENLTLNNVKARVETDAKKLWETAVKGVQEGNLDDRPLYWARNKMQVRLKRNVLFANDIDFETSLVKKGSELEKMIQLFEEKSRNYTDIDFSKAGNKKKLLITGFDPFVLNNDPTAPDNVKFGNVLQSNPSGINALSLHGKTIGNYLIQTLICPVRYKDFDEFKDGKGIIETFVQPFIQEVDMIMTVSQGGPFRFDVDRFPCKNRGGFMDNMLWGNSKDGYNKENFKQLSDGKEFYETTLPYEKMVPLKNNPSDAFWTYFNQTFAAKEKQNKDNNTEGIEVIENQYDKADISKCIIDGREELKSYTSIDGSGGNYLSNEIFYRVAKIREEQNPNLQTGHLHIPLTQTTLENKDAFIKNKFRNADKITKDINPIISDLIGNLIKIISNI